MAMINVIYVNQTSGKIEDSLLRDLIAKGEIAAFCSPHGWVDVRCERKSLVPGTLSTEGGNYAKQSQNTKGF